MLVDIPCSDIEPTYTPPSITYAKVQSYAVARVTFNEPVVQGDLILRLSNGVHIPRRLTQELIDSQNIDSVAYTADQTFLVATKEGVTPANRVDIYALSIGSSSINPWNKRVKINGTNQYLHPKSLLARIYHRQFSSLTRDEFVIYGPFFGDPAPSTALYKGTVPFDPYLHI